MTLRSYRGEHQRAVATSADGGESWSAARDEPALIEPICQASAIAWRASEDDGKDWILHANPAARARERKTQIGTGDRSAKIRTYNYPQSRVTDHRIGLTLYRLPEVIAGDLDELITALRLAEQEERLETGPRPKAGEREAGAGGAGS
jgi:hypothetical protein